MFKCNISTIYCVLWKYFAILGRLFLGIENLFKVQLFTSLMRHGSGQIEPFGSFFTLTVREAKSG